MSVLRVACNLLARRGALPCRRDLLDALHGLFQGCVRGSERKTDEVESGWTERGSGNGGHSTFFEHDAADLFGRHAGVSNVDPCVERALWRGAAESRNL